MLQSFLLVGLPYAAIAICIAGCVARFMSRRFSFSSLSSQFLESRKLRWGSVPWHIGIIIVLLGHILALGMPGVWSSLMANRVLLITVEIIGMAAATLALLGLTTLAIRRVTSGRVQAVTTVVDIALLGILIVQVLVGLLIATLHSYGASWATGTVSPYLWSLLALRPAPEFVAELPPLVQVHLALTWVLVLLTPFSRLVHVLSLPLQYIVRPPLLVIWANARRFSSPHVQELLRPSRRYFLRGSAGLAAGGSLLAVGTFGQLWRFFFGPRMSEEEEAALMEKKLARLKQAAHEKSLELERSRKEYIRIARLGELAPDKGHYFIDYEMRPALAFRDASGLPLLISAKCTHLGCTVGNTCNEKGEILCPCHVSYFDIKTGEPNAGAPATEPLPHLAWVLMDSKGDIVASKAPGGVIQGTPPTEGLEALDVFIAKHVQEGVG